MALTNEEIDALDTETLRKLVKRLNEWTCGEDCIKYELRRIRQEERKHEDKQ